MKNILFTICGRAGSKGLKSKNCLGLNGKPLVLYSISVIDLLKKSSNYNITVALNTDSDRLRDIVNSNYQVVDVPRKLEIAGDKSSKFEVIKDTYSYLLNNNTIKFDYIIDLDITSPLRTLSDLNNMVDAIDSGKYDCVCSVVKSRRNPYFNMVERLGDNIKLVIPSKFTARQQTPEVFDLNASMYAFLPDYLVNHDSIFEGKLGIVEMKDYCVLDIDSLEDYEWMQIIHKSLIEKDIEHTNVYDNFMKIGQ